ncbi:MAG TPA: N-6 DNA methylase [Frankiaceae bacterium]|nr:N-6 DNA methylase [Frankiaceae bacterium]
MSRLPAVATARRVLKAAGYADAALQRDYPVWLGPRGVEVADLVAFGRSAPKDMSTAVVAVSSRSIDAGFRIAQAIAAPFIMVASDHAPDLWVAEPSKPLLWKRSVSVDDVADIREWLRPDAALIAKVGLRQLPLFDISVNFLAAARSRNTEALTPIVAEAMQVARDLVTVGRKTTSDLRHRRAARLVVGALTVLVMRDRGERRGQSAEQLVEQAVAEHPSTFEWVSNAPRRERVILAQLVERLGVGIDYRSLDPALLSEVYENALVADDERERLGIHYTPPRLAAKLLADLPVETVPPEQRHVLDPCCGSGTLLVAAHDRLRDLQPSSWPDTHRHRDLAVHLHGNDVDPFAVEIARLTLFLHAQPAGNGWHVTERDTLEAPAPDFAPRIIVTNPPWKYRAEGRREQYADEFLRWSTRSLAPGGLLGILLPASWLNSTSSASIRAELTDAFEVFEVWRLPEGTFTAAQNAATVLLGRKRDGLGGRGRRVVREVHRGALAGFLADDAETLTHVTEGDAPLNDIAPPLEVHAPTVPLRELAVILSGPQPRRAIADRGEGTPYLNHFGDVRAYGVIEPDLLWHVAFPDDFQSSRGARIITAKKVLVSAARGSTSPWRFRVAIDTLGIAVRNSVRGVAPIDQSDTDLLFALAIILGSSVASAFAAPAGGDRNIPASVLPALPIPANRPDIARLAERGREAARLASAGDSLADCLRAAEELVFDCYGLSEDDRQDIARRFAGDIAPDGAVRFAAPQARPDPRTRSTFRRVGAVLGAEHGHVTLWVNGITNDGGVRVRLPARMPGWLARPGATFDVYGVDAVADVEQARYRFQPMAWQDLAYDADVPAPLFAE